MSNEIQNAPPLLRLIEVMGGIRPMARLFNTRASTVSGWKKRGCIPGKYLRPLNNLRKAGHLCRTLPDGTLLEISADDLFDAASGPLDDLCPEQMEDLIEESVEEVTGEPVSARQISGPA